jgi:AAA15 family ATPase/GTPase
VARLDRGIHEIKNSKEKQTMNLLRVKFSNHSSFKEEQEVFFTAEKKYSPKYDWNLIESKKTLGAEKILPVTVFYGANASGKTNLLDIFHKLIVFLGRRNRRQGSLGAAYQPFLLDKESSKKPSLIEVEFLLNNSRYEFQIIFNKEQIISEKLLKNEVEIYAKQSEKKLSCTDNSYISNEAKKEVNDLKERQDVLVLEILNNRGIEVFKNIYNFIETIAKPYELYEDGSLKKLYNDKKLQNKLLSFVKRADVGIVGMEIKPDDEQKIDIPEKFLQVQALLNDVSVEEVKKELLSVERYIWDFKHSAVKGERILKRESKGTKVYCGHLLNFIPAFLNGGVFIIDELEKNLHPCIVRDIIKSFHNKDINRAGAQLVFSTHDTNFLKPNILRRDEVWFVEKDEEGKSEAYPLSDFKNVDYDDDYGEGYLKGKFGAIPYLSNLEDLAKVLHNKKG